MARHYGLDWLRVFAFGILIFYHIGMVFVPWDFHVKLARVDWVQLPMLASNPWRLSLLFLVSGYASRALLARSPGVAAFARNRTARLLVPTLFAILVVVPPQRWAELVSKYGYTGSLWSFWTRDYFVFAKIAGLDLPTWQHLWFVVYLWVYTMALALLTAIVPGRVLQRGYDRLFAGAGQFVLPAAWLALVSAVLFPGARETHALVGDWVAHATYLPAFLFGFAMAGSERMIAGFARHWRAALAVAVLAYVVVAGCVFEFSARGHFPRPWGTIYSAARAIEGWAAIAALIGIAERFWNRDHRWRATLTEAVFPFYIVHQTVIVMVAFWLIPARLPLWADFAILVAATVAGCWAFYLGGRSVPWLRPLIGLRRVTSAA